MMEMQETWYSVVVSAAKEDGEGGKEFGFLMGNFSNRRMCLEVSF